jgi:Cof subfamily protein (haloacid dehalogenase superfamily)
MCRWTRQTTRVMTELICVCDLDGTLLGADATLSAFARDGLNRLIRGGVGLTVASGRSVQAMRALLRGVEFELPVIGLNGALISDFHSGDHLLIRALDPATAQFSLATLAANGASPVLTTWDGAHDRVHYTEGMNPASDWWIAEKRDYGDPRLRPTDDLHGVASEQGVILITGFVPDRSAEPLVAKLRIDTSEVAIVHAAPHIYCTGWTEIQIQHPQADKGHAIPAFLELTGLQDSTVLVCGNDLNDLGMFSYADQSIAPANAHPEVLAAASTTVSANDEDGVVHWLLGHAGLASP